MPGYRTIKVSELIAQVEYSDGGIEAHPKTLKISNAIAQVEHTGGGGVPKGVHVSNLIAQIEHGPTGDLPTGILISELIAQIEYSETYPNLPLSQYAPRILVDLYTDAGIVRTSTADFSIEEL